MHLFAPFIKFESWHGFDFSVLGGFSVFIHVDLDEDSFICELISQLGVLWSNPLAWAAPRSCEIDDDKLVTLEGLVEFSFGLQFSNHLLICVDT